MNSEETCQAVIDLLRPVGREKVRGFQPPWRTVFIYECKECGSKRRVFANSFIGKRPVPSVGGIVCGGLLSKKEVSNVNG